MKKREEIADWLVRQLSDVAAVKPDQVDTSLTFYDYGMDSMAMAALADDLSNWLGIKLKDGIAVDHPTIDSLAAYVSTRVAGAPAVRKSRPPLVAKKE